MQDYTCPLGCTAKLETPTELAEHCIENKVFHNKEYNCRCLNCKESFKTARQWAEHWTDRHCQRCGLCTRYLSSFYTLALHCERDHKSAPYACSCKYCQQQFKTASDWGAHFTQHHLFVCPMCGKEGNRLEALGKHITEDHPEKIINLLECYLCKRVYNNLNDWFEHYSTHHNGQLNNQLTQSNVRKEEKNEIKHDPQGEHYKKELEKVQEENVQLRQIIYQLGKNSTQLMDKISQDPTTKQFIKSWHNAPIISTPTPQLKALTFEHEKRTQSLIQEDGNSCIICFEHKREIACFPCGHFIYCRNCVPKEKSKCAICSTEVLKLEKVYLV